ncbi:hypothetical protein ENKNEFLB_00822 [Nocardioides aquaticus]|uniref:DUF3040 domain-containing protein n=1 Tax=Nocardioides aquaticus TaxID=160826 RepID=A0ABX8EEX8_9ACTN|nr:hypothetical protein [Nocardioides aquaticus]QVT78445.1 hypothetical protein ENKNEFLB_00822 [Nocardioides aquaticus]
MSPALGPERDWPDTPDGEDTTMADDLRRRIDDRFPHLRGDLDRWAPAPTRRRETQAVAVMLAALLLVSVVAVAIGAPPLLLVLLAVPVAVLYLGRWAARVVMGDDPVDGSGTAVTR